MSATAACAWLSARRSTSSPSSIGCAAISTRPRSTYREAGRGAGCRSRARAAAARAGRLSCGGRDAIRRALAEARRRHASGHACSSQPSRSRWRPATSPRPLVSQPIGSRRSQAARCPSAARDGRSAPMAPCALAKEISRDALGVLRRAWEAWRRAGCSVRCGARACLPPRRAGAGRCGRRSRVEAAAAREVFDRLGATPDLASPRDGRDRRRAIRSGWAQRRARSRSCVWSRPG